MDPHDSPTSDRPARTEANVPRALAAVNGRSVRALVRAVTAERPTPRFLEGSSAVHREHGVVDVLAVVGPQRLIRVPTGRCPSEIAVLAVHVDELAPHARDERAPR